MLRNIDLNVGDELYKVRDGEKLGYYKIVVTKKYEISGKKIKYEYYAKGRGCKRPTKFFVGVKILAYKYLFYTDKMDMLVDFLTNDIFQDKKPSPMIVEELESAKLKDEYFV